MVVNNYYRLITEQVNVALLNSSDGSILDFDSFAVSRWNQESAAEY